MNEKNQENTNSSWTLVLLFIFVVFCAAQVGGEKMEKEEMEEKIERIEKKMKDKVEQVLNKDKITHEDYMILMNELSALKFKLDEKERKAKKNEYSELINKMMSTM